MSSNKKGGEELFPIFPSDTQAKTQFWDTDVEYVVFFFIEILTPKSVNNIESLYL